MFKLQKSEPVEIAEKYLKTSQKFMEYTWTDIMATWPSAAFNDYIKTLSKTPIKTIQSCKCTFFSFRKYLWKCTELAMKPLSNVHLLDLAELGGVPSSATEDYIYQWWSYCFCFSVVINSKCCWIPIDNVNLDRHGCRRSATASRVETEPGGIFSFCAADVLSQYYWAA